MRGFVVRHRPAGGPAWPIGGSRAFRHRGARAACRDARSPRRAATVSAIELALRRGAAALTEDLAQLLAALDGSESLRERVAAVRKRIDELLVLDISAWPTLAGTVERVTSLLRATPTWPAPQSEAWTSLRRQLVEAYDGLVAILPVDEHEPRPTNLARASFHVSSALAGLVATLVLFTTAQLPFAAGTLAGGAWTLELLRRRSPALNARLMGFFGRIARPSEAHRVNSGTWYMTALVVLTLTYSPLLCVVSVAVLGFGDPAAAIVGSRVGKIQLRHGRTLEGSLAFVTAGTIAALVVMALLPSPPALGLALPVALVAATSGALAELFAHRVDDNLTIPLAAMVGAWLTTIALGASVW